MRRFYFLILKRVRPVIDLRVNVYLNLHKLLLIRQIKPAMVCVEIESKDKEIKFVAFCASYTLYMHIIGLCTLLIFLFPTHLLCFLMYF